MEQKLLQFLSNIYGTYKKLNNGEVAFHCPFCNHRKKKLQINLDKANDVFGYWHCWVCDEAGKNPFTLLKRSGKSTDHNKKRLAKLLGKRRYVSNRTDDERDKIYVQLPEEFVSLTNSKHKNHPEFKMCISHLKMRGLGPMDVVRYNIGYCFSGKYQQRLIIPSYDADDKLNYFVGRSIYQGENLPYLNPKVEKDAIIMFENQINWDLPVTITEGVFDAMAVKRNAVPMLGKKMGDYMKERIIVEGVKDLIIALDQDAIDDAIRLANHFHREGISTKVIDPPKSDPDEVGYKSMTHLIKRAEKLDDYEFMKMKLNRV